MLIKLDPRSGDPIYQQLVDQIRQMVAAGQPPPGAQLPTVRQLAVELRINPNTVARAYTRLAEIGVISTQQGRGTYVLDTPPPADQHVLRRARLAAHLDQTLSELERLGYTLEEIETAWNEHLPAWLKARKPNHP
jgi:GntR family transcriptional regulator